MTEKLGDGLGSKLRHGPEMVDSVSPPFPVRDVVLIPDHLPIFLHSSEMKSGSGLGMRLGFPAPDKPSGGTTPKRPSENTGKTIRKLKHYCTYQSHCEATGSHICASDSLDLLNPSILWFL